MINSTLCYIEKEDEWLLLHRTKKENDLNRDKWIGIGGKFEDKESPEDCIIRETLEETGLKLTSYRYRGIVTFVSDVYETEYMHLFTADGFEGIPGECDEGDLEWIRKDDFAKLPQWEGDKIFLNLLERDVPFFSLKLEYEGENLISAFLNGKQIRPYKGAVFFDLDGTLLDNDSDHVPESAGRAIRYLKENGYLVCLSTGRDMDTHYSRKYLKEADPDAIIHLNGSKITAGNELVLLHHMEEELLEKIIDFAKINGFCVGTSIGEKDYYLNPELKEAADRTWNKFTKRNFVPVTELLTDHIPVVALNFSGKDTGIIKKAVEKSIPEIEVLPFNGATGADVVEKGFSKAEGLKTVCAYYGIDPENTWAFGDSVNDISILKEAKYGIAMGNATEDVKRIADYVTDSVGNDGIEKALKHYGLVK